MSVRSLSLLEEEIKAQLGSLNPLDIFKDWLRQALKTPSVTKDKACFMVLSSCYKNQVSSRVVLMKKLKRRGAEAELIFYSNYLSFKGRQFEKNPSCALNFYWPELNKQVRIEGPVLRTSRQQSLQYWRSRSRASQISQWLSNQSQKASSKKEILSLKHKAELKFKNKPVPCPSHWGGYRAAIQKIEFWLEGKSRLHDRFLFEKKGASWKTQRLFP